MLYGLVGGHRQILLAWDRAVMSFPFQIADQVGWSRAHDVLMSQLPALDAS